VWLLTRESVPRVRFDLKDKRRCSTSSRLARDRRIDAATLETVRLVDTFGSLIANTDRHFGNLAFFDHYDGRFRLAPVYDMLPMLYAPEHDQLAARSFAPPDPSSAELRAG
jgi:HipA-like C-terminal domain